MRQRMSQKVEMAAEASVPARSQPNYRIELVLGLLVLTGLLVFLYADVVAHMAQDWYNDPDYSHGFLIPVLPPPLQPHFPPTPRVNHHPEFIITYISVTCILY